MTRPIPARTGGFWVIRDGVRRLAAGGASAAQN